MFDNNPAAMPIPGIPLYIGEAGFENGWQKVAMFTTSVHWWRSEEVVVVIGSTSWLG